MTCVLLMNSQRGNLDWGWGKCTWRRWRRAWGEWI